MSLAPGKEGASSSDDTKDQYLKLVPDPDRTLSQQYREEILKQYDLPISQSQSFYPAWIRNQLGLCLADCWNSRVCWSWLRTP